MKSYSFRAFLIGTLAATIWLPLLVLTSFLVRDLERSGRRSLEHSLTVAITTSRRFLAGSSPAVLREQVRTLDRGPGIRLTVIGRDGRVVADSHALPEEMENHLERPEIAGALATGEGRAERFSSTLGTEMLYLAATDPEDPDAPIYRAAAPLSTLRGQIRGAQATLVMGLIVLFLASLAGAAWLRNQVVTPVEALAAASARFASGEKNARVLPAGPSSLRRLGSSFNEMVDRLNLQLQRLDEAQGYLDTILRQIPNGLLVLDSRGTITRANAAAESLLGLTDSRIVGRPILAVLLSYAVDVEVRRVLEGARGSDVDVRLPDGRSLRVAVGPLVIAGAPAGAVVLLQDISALRRADEMRRDFVANVSHELRTPVASIRALIETLMLRGAKRPELLEEYGPRVVHECERMEHLVQDLMLLAETESGHIRLQPEAIHPREVVADVFAQVEPLAADAGTRLEMDAFADAEICADRFALGQCVRNLVDNAIKHAAGGTVAVGSRLEGSEVVLHVADTGIGIPPEEVSRIFERFYRVDKARARANGGQRGGSGLGLAIVKHLAEAQGGRAWVESREGTGSTFYLAFPRAVSRA